MSENPLRPYPAHARPAIEVNVGHRWWLIPAAFGYLAYGAAFALLSKVMQVLNASTTYMLWNGLGTVGGHPRRLAPVR